MFSKSINLKSFKINKNKKKIQNKLKILLSEKNQLIKSLSKNYKDSYDFKKILSHSDTLYNRVVEKRWTL